MAEEIEMSGISNQRISTTTTTNTLAFSSYSLPADNNKKKKKDEKVIFDELKELIFEGDWEGLLMKFMEYKENDFPIDFQDSSENNYALIHHAAVKGQVECLRVLIMELSADPNIKADNGYTPIHLLVSSDCSCRSCISRILDCLQILRDAGANLDAETYDLKETPLYSAARNRLSEPARFLLANGANINHWVDNNGTPEAVSTLLAQYVPEVLKSEFDKRILIDSKKGIHRSLRLDFRLLLQEVAVAEGFSMNSPNKSPSSSPLLIVRTRRRRAKNFPPQQTQTAAAAVQNGKREVESDSMIVMMERKMPRERRNETTSFINNENRERTGSISSSSTGSTTMSSTSNSSMNNIPPRETELLNYLLKADFDAAEAVVNHPLVEAFVYLKWRVLRRLFFLLKSFYFFVITLYTFYVFETFVNATCSYTRGSSSESNISANGLPPPPLPVSGAQDQDLGNVITLRNVSNSGSGSSWNNNATTFEEKAAEFSLPPPSLPATAKLTEIKKYGFYYWHSFSEYFKAHEMTCEPTLKTQIMAYILSAYVITLVSYELYKCFESWYDYLKNPLSLAWWIVAINFGVTVMPGLGIYAHTWLYPYAAFSLVFGWIFVLAQVERLPYFGNLVGVFVKVLKDFIILLFTFSPVLLAYALGFSVLLPQNEFFRFLPTAFFKVFLMMSGDVDFMGVFRGTWTSVEHQGHVYIPLFIIYTGCILTVTMVLMSLLLGLAVDNIQEVRREAALFRTVRLIQEIGIFESILHKPFLFYCGFAKYFRRLFSITSLKCMNGPDLIIYPEDPQDQTLPIEIKKKLIPYLASSCCSLEKQQQQTLNLHQGENPCDCDILASRKRRSRMKDGSRRRRNNNATTVVAKENEKRKEHFTFLTSSKLAILINEKKAAAAVGKDADNGVKIEKAGAAADAAAVGKMKPKDVLRREFFLEKQKVGLLEKPSAASVNTEVEMEEVHHHHHSPNHTSEEENQQLKKRLLQRDLLFFQEIKLLLEDNERLKNRLEILKYKLIHNRDQQQ